MIPAAAGQPLDVLVIGGGQAGLALGYHLAAWPSLRTRERLLASRPSSVSWLPE
jgi:glycine/D-amino acid oxidase-like deaminating enzyme